MEKAKLVAHCPHCEGILSDPSQKFGERDGVRLKVELNGGQKTDFIWLDPDFGSLKIKSPNFEISDRAEVKFFCPYPDCFKPLSRDHEERCGSCRAPMFSFRVMMVQDVIVCSRRGCPKYEEKPPERMTVESF